MRRLLKLLLWSVATLAVAAVVLHAMAWFAPERGLERRYALAAQPVHAVGHVRQDGARTPAYSHS